MKLKNPDKFMKILSGIKGEEFKTHNTVFDEIEHFIENTNNFYDTKKAHFDRKKSLVILEMPSTNNEWVMGAWAWTILFIENFPKAFIDWGYKEECSRTLGITVKDYHNK